MKKCICLSIGMFFLLAGVSRAQIKVESMKFGTGVESNEVTGEAASFPASTETVYCWMRVTGGEGQSVKVKWSLNGTLMSDIDLEIKYPSMRTYASKTIAGNTGEWKVEVLSTAGDVLQSGTFKIE